MKWNSTQSLAMIAGLAIILPMSVFAEDPQTQDEKKQGKEQKGTQKHRSKEVSQQVTRNSAPSGASSRGAGASNDGIEKSGSGRAHNAGPGSKGHATVQRSHSVPTTSKTVSSAGRREYDQRDRAPVHSKGYTSHSVRPVAEHSQRTQNRSHSDNGRYNKSNRYGGHWYSSDTHRDWDRNREHYHNQHRYRWYDGGWLIIDAGFNPFYVDTGYSYGGSLSSRVQSRLADQGYYRGAIDGQIGPASRNAIASYQGDHGLSATGRINDALLSSLRVN